MALPTSANDYQKPKKISKRLTTALTTASRTFRSDLDKFSMANSAYLKIESQSKHFADGNPGYPQGCKPFNSSEAFLELDEPWSFCENTNHSLCLNIPAGSSRRHVGQLLHQFFMRNWKLCESEAALSRLNHLRELVKPDVLKQSVLDAMQPVQQDLAEQLGVVRPHIDLEDDLEAAVAHKYKSLYLDFERSLKAKEAQSAKEKQMLETQTSQVLQSDPKNLFETAVESKVETLLAAKLAKLGLSDEPDETMGQPAANAAAFVESIQQQKNGESLAAAAGHNILAATPKHMPKPKQHGSGSNASGKKRGKNGPRRGTGN